MPARVHNNTVCWLFLVQFCSCCCCYLYNYWPVKCVGGPTNKNYTSTHMQIAINRFICACARFFFSRVCVCSFLALRCEFRVRVYVCDMFHILTQFVCASVGADVRGMATTTTTTTEIGSPRKCSFERIARARAHRRDRGRRCVALCAALHACICIAHAR